MTTLRGLLSVAGSGSGALAPGAPDSRARFLAAAGAVLVVLGAGCATPGAGSGAGVSPPDPGQLAEMKIAGVGFDPESRGYVVVVESLDRATAGTVVHMVVGEPEAQALSMKLSRQSFARPMTHDLTVSLLSALNGAIEHVVVEDLREGTFLARIYVRDARGVLRSVDSRASDALILGAATGTRIHFLRRIVREAGVRPPPPKGAEGTI